MVARVMISGTWRPIGEARHLLNRTYKRDSDGQFASTGGSDGGEDDDVVELRDPSVVYSATVGDYEIRTVDDPDGTLLGVNASGDPGTYVTINDPNIGRGVDEAVLYASPGEARSIADGVTRVSAEARAATPPRATPDGDRTPEYEDGPALLASGTFAGYPVAAYHDAYDDLGGGTFLAIGEKGTTANWDTAQVRPDISEAGAFADALRGAAQGG